MGRALLRGKDISARCEDVAHVRHATCLGLGRKRGFC